MSLRFQISPAVVIMIGWSISLILCSCFNSVNGAPYSLGRPHITFYDHEYQKGNIWIFSYINSRECIIFMIHHKLGERYHQDVGPKCYNLPRVFDDRASSLDTHHTCIKVCTETDCRGCYNMKPGTKGHFTLREVHLNDNISSFTQC